MKSYVRCLLKEVSNQSKNKIILKLVQGVCETYSCTLPGWRTSIWVGPNKFILNLDIFHMWVRLVQAFIS